MAADFDKPTVSNTHVNVLSQLRDNQNSLARMFSDGGEANIPLRSVRFLNNIMYLWNGSIWEVAPVAIGGGGTGAQTAAAARASLGTNIATNVDTGVFSADRVPTLSIADKTSGTLDGDRVDQATTSDRGTVQLNNTLTSTSTTQALTAAQGKVLADRPYISQSGNNSAGYWRIWSDGFIEQWKNLITPSGSNVTWLLPIQFTDVSSLIVSTNRVGVSLARSWTISSLTTSSVSFLKEGTSSENSHVMVSGY